MRALVISGGGSKSSFTAGVLRYLLDDLKNHYDIICGVSAGAIMAAHIGMFPIGSGYLAARSLWKTWSTITTEKVWKRWFPFGRFHGLWKSSIYDSTPLIKWIKSSLDLEKIRQSKRKLRVGAVSLNTGEFRLFSEQDDCFIDGVLASSSFPGMLLPIKIENEYYSDGGIKCQTPIKYALDLGAIDIDVIITCPESSSLTNLENTSALTVAYRSIDLMCDELIQADIDKALFYNDLVLSGNAPDKKALNIKIYRPEFTLLEDSLSFQTDKMNELLEYGYNLAKKL